MTETIQSKECQIKWQDFDWVFIHKTGQMASVVLPVSYWSHLLESFIQTMVQTEMTGSSGMCNKSCVTPLHLS